MPHLRLVGVYAKLDRAREHVEELNSAAECWFKNAPGPQFETEVKGEWEMVRLRIPEPPPPRLPVIAGDIVHNLRSSLDHLAYQLVESIAGKATRDTYFPVCVSDTQFRQLLKRVDKRGRKNGPLAGIPTTHDVIKVIRGHQPYNRGDPKKGFTPDQDPLAFVNSMWNIDKHRMLHATFLAAPETAQQVFDLFEVDPEATLLQQHVGKKVLGRSLVDGIELARFRFAADNRPKPHVRPKGPLPTHIMIGYVKKGPGSMRIGLRGWDRIFTRIDQVIADTGRFLK